LPPLAVAGVAVDVAAGAVPRRVQPGLLPALEAAVAADVAAAEDAAAPLLKIARAW
jgi:hypothetical protein